MPKAKILIVEDEGVTALSVKSLLEDWGYNDISIALSGVAAIQNVVKFNPDLILMDIKLREDIDGIEIAKKLQNDFDIPIVYLTAHSDENTLERAKLTGPYGYVLKPFSNDELKVTIDTALYRHKLEKELKKTNELLQTELERRKHAEDELKKSEEKYRTIVETTHEGIVIFNEESEIDYANKQMAEMLGYRAEDMKGSHAFNFINDKYRLKVQNELKPRGKGVTCNLELPLRKKDGSYIWTLISGNTLFDSKDNFIGILCVIKDISERKKAEVALEESEEKFRSIIEQSHDGIVIVDNKGILMEWNYGMEEITGYKRKNVLGKYIWEIQCQLNPEEKRSSELYNGLKAKDIEIIKNGDFKQHDELFEVEIQHVEGTKRFVQIRYFPIKTNKEKIVASVVRDVTEQKKIEENLKSAKDNLEEKVQKRTRELRESNESLKMEIKERKEAEEALIESRNYLDKIINSIADPVFVKDKQHRWVLVNDAFCELMGYSREELLGKSDHDFLPSREADVFWEKDEEVFKTGIENVNEEEITDSNGNVHIIVTKKTLYTDISGEKYIVAIIRDVTELKKAEEDLKESEAQLNIAMDLAKIVYWEYDINLDLFTFNDRFYNLYGTTARKEGGRQMSSEEFASKFIPHEESSVVAEEIAKALKTDDPNFSGQREHSIIRADGEKRFIIVYYEIIKDAEGRTIKMYGANQDITERKKAEEGKRREHQKLMDIIEFLPDATFVIDQDSKVIAWNRAIEKMTGVPKEEILGKGDYAYSIPFYGFKRPILIDLILSQNNEAESLYDHVEREGDTLYGDVFMPDMFEGKGAFLWGKASPLYDDEGNFVGAIESIRDISKHKNAEKAIKEQFLFLQNLIDTIPYPIFYKDTEYLYQGCNKAFEDIMGLQKDKIIGKTVYDISPRELADKYHEKDKELFENPDTQIYEEKVQYANGSMHDVIFNKKTYNDVYGNISGLIGIMADITEHKKTEKAIKRSEAYYKTIFENTGTAAIIIEEDTTISLVNAEFEKLCGYSKEEIEGKKSWKKFISGDDIEKMEEYHGLRRIDPELAPNNYEFKFIDRSGSVKDVLITVAMIPRTKKSLASLLDITDKKKAENDLRESEIKLKIAMDMAKLAYWEYDVDSDLFTFNDRFYKLYGTTTEEEGGSKMSAEEYARRFIPPEESHVVAEEIAKALETDDPDFFGQIEHSIIRADGEKRFIVVRHGVIKDDKGQTIKTYGANQDITELKKAEEETKKQLKRLDIINKIILTANRSDNLQSLLKDVLSLVLDLMNFSGGGIYLIDQNDEVAKIERFIGLPQDFINVVDNIKINEYPFREVYIEGKSLFIDKFDKVYSETSKPWNFKSLAAVPICSEEKIIGSLNLVSKRRHSFTDKEKNLINSIGREIGNTISKLITEEKMKKLIAELKRSNDELQRFAYITSHDLQEPLRTIASFTQLLERRYKDKLDSDADEFIDYIVEASVRMKQMINDLLEYSMVVRVERKCKPLKSEDVLLNVLNSLNLMIEENNVEITCDSLPSLIADENQLARVFQNLIENAIKFKKENHPIRVHISARVDKENNEYVFSVRDNGIGIEKQYFDRIFTIFQRLHTREEYQGTGIGLSISKRIIGRHGGRMWVESSFGVGSTFYFTLPIK